MADLKKSQLTRVLLASTAVLAFGSTAHAAAAAPVSGSSPAGVEQLGEVVVTALKREQVLLKTAVPVTALQPEALQRAGAISFQDYLAQVPGFNAITGREGNSQLILRGITTGPQPNSTVGTYVDDMPFGSSAVFTSGGTLTPDIDPSDLQRIEVLRGPQGTLYGANTLGGLLKFVTTPPDLSGYHARVEADAENVDHGGNGYGLRAMANIPLITDKLAVRANIFDREDPGYIDNLVNGQKNVDDTRVKGGRVSLLWTPTDKLSFRLTATGEDLNSQGAPDVDVDVHTLAPLYGAYDQKRYAAERLDNRYRAYGGEMHWDLGFATLSNSVGYNTLNTYRDVDDTVALGGLLSGAFGIPNFGVYEPEPIRQSRFTDEVRLASTPGTKLDWLLGFYFDAERGDQDQGYTPFDTTTGSVLALPNLATVSLRSRYVEYAGFADVTFHVTSQFDLLWGLRYSANDQHYTQGEGGLLAGGPTTYEVSSSSDGTTTFLVNPEFKINSDNLAYVRIASGYRPGGPNALAPDALAAHVPTSFKPDSLINYEVGYKASLFDHKLTLDLSAFYIDWSDVQLLSIVGQFTVEGNGGAATSKGVEGNITYTPFHGLNLSDNFAYTNAQLSDDAPGAGGLKGDHLPYVPQFSDTLNGDYDWTLIPGWKAYVGASYHYVGARPSQFAVGAIQPKIPSYNTVDLRAGVTYEGYAFDLYAKNVNDSRGISSLASEGLSPGINPYAATLIQPRTIGISVSSKF